MNLHARKQNLKDRVKADLVVAGPGGAVADAVGLHFLSHARDELGLEHAFGGNGQGINPAAQDVSLY